MRPRYIVNLNEIEQIPPLERERLKEVTGRHFFLANDYYLGLIDWEDPEDPIRRIVIPDEGEKGPGGELDPSSESSFTVIKGMEHKYGPTALILASGACGGACRFCFRKRIFMPGNNEAIPDLSSAFRYLREHKEINNVLLSGGDPLALPTEHLEHILKELYKIEHIRFVRIGTKMVVYDPFRILDDPSLIDLVRRFSRPRKKLYFITDINHPRELTRESIHAINLLQKAGGVFSNQTPLLKGINDDVETLKELFNKLAAIGVSPYYVFQCRPTVGNGMFTVPLEEGYQIFEKTKAEVSGLAKRSRFIMSHATGKLEIAALTDRHIIFKYHNAAHEENNSRVLIFKRNPDAVWLEDYTELVGSFGPEIERSVSDGSGREKQATEPIDQ